MKPQRPILLFIFLFSSLSFFLVFKIHQANPQWMNNRKGDLRKATGAYQAPPTQLKRLDSSCRATAQYRYDEKRTGVAPKTHQPKPKLKIIKRVPVNAGIHSASKSSPTVDDSGVYVGSDAGWFLKMNHDGEILWSFYIPGSGNGIHGSAAIDDKKVYIGAYNGFLYALDKMNGDLVWANPVADYIGASPLLAGGFLYISAETSHPDGLVAKIDCNTGKTLWVSQWLGGHSHSSPTYDENNKLILAGANSGRFHAFHENSGETAWKIQIHGQIKGTAMIHDSQVFFASWSKNYHSLDLKTGKENWQSFMVNQIQTSLTLVPGENIGITNAPIGEIVGINLEDGTIAWRLRHGDRNNQFSVLVTQNPDKQGHYLAWSRCKESQLCTLDAKTGKLIYNMDLPGALTGVPFAYKKRLYINLDEYGGLVILE